MTTITIHADQIEAFRAEIAKLTKRANKLDVESPVIVSVGLIRPRTLADDVYGDGSIVVDVEVSDVTVMLSGWTLTAVITPLGEGTIVSTVPGQVAPARAHEWTGDCDHCHTIRRRNSTFALHHEDGTDAIVGSSCLADFLGHKNAAQIADLLGVFAELRDCGERCPRGERIWALDEVLGFVSAYTSLTGWVSAQASYNSTSSAQEILTIMSTTSRDPFAQKVRDVSSDHDAEVALAIEWASGMAGYTDFALNVRTIADQRMVTAKAFGTACWILIGYRKSVSEAVAKAAKTFVEVSDSFLGKIGAKISCKATIVSYSLVETSFGTTAKINMVAETGESLIWWSSNTSVADISDIGKIVGLCGTVKSHSKFRGQKQTTMTRCKMTYL